jgi:hypothetical protein
LTPGRLGLRTIDQAVPFHDSIKVLGELCVLDDEPTAVQALADGHDMAVSASVRTILLGLGTMVQASC